MHVGEYGLPILLNAGIDLSSYPALSIQFTRPNRTEFVVESPDVTLGMVDISTPIGTFFAFKYVSYTFKVNDLGVAGTWQCQLGAGIPLIKQLYSSPVSFQVDN